MKEYLQCSLFHAQDKIGKIVLLFSSDERDENYRRTICQMVESQGPACIDLDALIKMEIERLLNPSIVNNYFVFEVVRQISNRVQFKLERRRQLSCSDCNNVTETLPPFSFKKNMIWYDAFYLGSKNCGQRQQWQRQQVNDVNTYSMFLWSVCFRGQENNVILIVFFFQ